MVTHRTSGLFWPTLLTAAGLLMLVLLGTWQLERKAWKDDLVRRIAQGTRAEPILLDAAETLVQRGENLEYARVRARGRLHPDKTRYVFAADQRGTGWHVYTPLETPAGTIVLVNRGWIGDSDRQDRIAEAPALAAREVEVVGLLRHPGARSVFAPPSEPERNIWYWRDHAGMVQSAFPGGARRVAPFVLDAEAQPPSGVPGDRQPRGGTTILALPNRHLEYALTWYGLALALLVVYGSFAWQRVRSGRHRSLLGRSSGRA